jgi:hypothetical protein
MIMTLLESMSLDTKIAIASAFAAVIAALFAFRSNWIAKKALEISEKQYFDNQPDFNLYYNEGYRFIAQNGDIAKRLLLFHLTIRNKSGFKNTFKSDLEIEYLRNDDSLAKLIVEHNPRLKDFLRNKDLTVFSMDIELNAKTTSTKWLIFEQPDFLDNSHRIDRYIIKLTDMNENKSCVEAVLIKDIDA